MKRQVNSRYITHLRTPEGARYSIRRTLLNDPVLDAWVDKFFIPDGETRTISQIRDDNYEESNQYWGDAKQQLVEYLLKNR